jgi:hypothetical protein
MPEQPSCHPSCSPYARRAKRTCVKTSGCSRGYSKNSKMSPTERRAFEGESWLGSGVQHLISSRFQDAHRNFEHHYGPSAWWQLAFTHASLGAEALELRGMLDDGFRVKDEELQAISTRPCRNRQIFDTREGFWREDMERRSTGNSSLVIMFNVSEGQLTRASCTGGEVCRASLLMTWGWVTWTLRK